VRCFNLRSSLLVLSISFLVVLVGPVQADPLTTFTLTDLGPGTPTFATGANGDGIVIAGNGQTAYSFQMTQDASLTEKQLLSGNVPVAVAAPVSDPETYGNPANAYSVPFSASTNGQGTLVVVGAYGVYGHGGQSDVYAVQQNPNGTWGTPTELWSGDVQYSGQPGPGFTSITGINKLNEVLGVGSGIVPYGPLTPVAYLYNLNTNSVLNLLSLNVIAAGGWSDLQPIAIDNQGRILLEASPSPTSGQTSEQFLLLTPEGVSSTPLQVPAPEPGPLALAVLTMGGLALRRAVCSRR
jgi:hypothetical protein